MPRGASYRPNYGSDTRRPQGDRYVPMYRFSAEDSNNASTGPPPPPPEFTFRPPKKGTSERPLLQNRLIRGPDFTLGTVNHEGAVAKFQNIDDMSDSDDQEMDVSEDDDGNPIAHIQDPLPKWSSAEIYTSLPPPTESRKKRDVVKLIRKARLEHKFIDDLQTGVETNDDFISFGIDSADQEMFDLAPADAPKGPRDDGLSPKNNRKRKRDVYLEQQMTAPAVMRRGKVAHKNGAILPEWQPRASENPTPWFTKHNTDSANGIEHGLTALHQEVCDFYDWVKPRHFEHVMREELISRLHRCLQRLEPGSQIHAFGSFASGMYLPNGDMDLVLLTGPFISAKATGRLPPPSRSIHPYVNLIRKEGIAVPGSILPIPKAKVPIIKFVDMKTGLRVDLSFNNTTGLDANETYEHWKTQYPGMRQIASIVKHYLMIRGLGDVSVGGLGGFSLTCLVVSLLQLKPQAQRPLSLGSNLIEFFNLYGKHFNRVEFGIRVDFPGYFEKKSFAPFAHNKDKPRRLAISDPNRPDNNISGGTDEIDLICDCFASVYEILTEALEERNLGIGSKGSLLGDIIGGYYEAYKSQRDHLWRLFETTISGGSSAYVQPAPPKQQATTTIPPKTQSGQPKAKKISVKIPSKPVAQPDQRKLPARPTKTTSSNTASGPSAHSSTHLAQSSSQSQQHQATTKACAGKTKPNKAVKNTTPTMPSSSDESETNPANNNGVKLAPAERRANRIRDLRPDIPSVPKRLPIKRAVKIGGYKNVEEMKKDLLAREDKKKKKKN
ncbi:MAG: hypothetical protein Q9160_001323 [Pyrenula sp. 1 TL-2023]